MPPKLFEFKFQYHGEWWNLRGLCLVYRRGLHASWCQEGLVLDPTGPTFVESTMGASTDA
jgi:hypothetical protein